MVFHFPRCPATSRDRRGVDARLVPPSPMFGGSGVLWINVDGPALESGHDSVPTGVVEVARALSLCPI